MSLLRICCALRNDIPLPTPSGTTYRAHNLKRLLSAVTFVVVAVVPVPLSYGQGFGIEIRGYEQRPKGFVEVQDLKIEYSSDGLLHKVKQYRVTEKGREILEELSRIERKGSHISASSYSLGKNAAEPKLGSSWTISEENGVPIAEDSSGWKSFIKHVSTRTGGYFQWYASGKLIRSFSLADKDTWLKSSIQGYLCHFHYSGSALSRVTIDHPSGVWEGMSAFWDVISTNGKVVFTTSPGPGGVYRYVVNEGAGYLKGMVKKNAIVNLLLFFQPPEPVLFPLLTGSF